MMPQLLGQISQKIEATCTVHSVMGGRRLEMRTGREGMRNSQLVFLVQRGDEELSAGISCTAIEVAC